MEQPSAGDFWREHAREIRPVLAEKRVPFLKAAGAVNDAPKPREGAERPFKQGAHGRFAGNVGLRG